MDPHLPVSGEATKVLRLAPQQVCFPARCIYCGASPAQEIVIQTWKGVDLIYVAWGHYCRIAAPTCAACTGRRRRARLLFWIGMFTTFLGFLVGNSLLLRASPSLMPVVIPVLVIGSIAGLWWMRRRALDLFQRWFYPLWLRNWRPKENLVEVHFRDPVLANDVAMLSGQKATAVENAGYRTPQKVEPPPAWQRPSPKSMARWKKVALSLGIAILMFTVGLVQFSTFAEFERSGASISVDARILILYKLGGKYAVLGLFCFCGVVFTFAAVAFASRRAAAWLSRFRRHGSAP